MKNNWKFLKIDFEKIMNFSNFLNFYFYIIIQSAKLTNYKANRLTQAIYHILLIAIYSIDVWQNLKFY